MVSHYISFMVFMVLSITCLALIVLGWMLGGRISRRWVMLGIVAVLLTQTIVVLVLYYNGVPLR